MDIGTIIFISLLAVVFIIIPLVGQIGESMSSKNNTPSQDDDKNIIETPISIKEDNKNIVDTPKPNKPTTLQYTIDISGKKNVDRHKLCCLLLDKYSLEYFENLQNKYGNQTVAVSGTRKNKKQIHHHIYTIDVPYITIQVTYDEIIKIGQSKIQQLHERQKLNSTLRERIKKRDNYTCRICGKQMFDSVGIHIDHIIPISKGGLTVEENLQVLCSVCNLKKSNKTTNTAQAETLAPTKTITPTKTIVPTETLAQIKENIKNINEHYNLNAIFIQIDRSIQNAIRSGHKSYYFNITEYGLPEIAITRLLSHYSTDKFDATLYDGNDGTSTYVRIIW